MNNFYEDTLTGLLQAISIENGNTSVEEVPDMVAKTYRASEYVNMQNLASSEKDKSTNIVNI